MKNDIALVQLQSSVNYRNGISPACLPDKYRGFPLPNLNNNPAVIGWGSKGTNQATVTHLREATVPIVDIPTCKNNYQPVSGIGEIDNTQICTYDTCKGDSGGALFLKEDGRYKIS